MVRLRQLLVLVSFFATATLVSGGCTPDSQGPLRVEFLSTPASTTDERSAQFEFQCVDEERCKFVCELSGVAGGVIDSGECDSGQSYTDLVNDEYTFTVFASVAEDQTSASITWSWTVDADPVEPIIVILSAPPTETSEGRVVLEFECANTPCSFECALDYDDGSGSLESGSWESCSSPHSIEELLPGEYVLRIRATDEEGNQSVETVSWIELIAPWTKVSAGEEYTCGVRADGTLWCWGLGSEGQLGLEDRNDRHFPHRVGNDSDWTIVSTSVAHTCGVRGDGTLWCWGRGFSGQLGLGDNLPRQAPDQVGSDGDWVTVTTGRNHSCGTRVDGTLWCWGFGFHGLGDTDRRLTPEQVGSQTDWTAISAGDEHTCGIRGDGTLWCWGNGVSGRLGLGDSSERLSPTQVGTQTDWTSVSAGREHTCGLRTDGTLWCWGYGRLNQLGVGDGLSHSSPTRVGSDLDWVAVSAGDGHTCALKDDDTLWCWGSNQYGRLGLSSDQYSHPTPRQVESGSDWTVVSASRWHTCGVGDGGALHCWGLNKVGQLGLGSHGGEKAFPYTLDSSEHLVVVAAGGAHSCGISLDGRLWCWGKGTSVGLDEMDSQIAPEQVGISTDWADIALGSDHTCGIRDNGTLWCWGENGGRLGLGDTTHRRTPVRVGSHTNWTVVSAGDVHTCGLRDGTLWCWGVGGAHLGLGDSWPRLSPEQVGNDNDWASVSAGYRHTCGVRNDGTLWCWGRDTLGELGMGDNNFLQHTPAQVGSGNDWTAVSTGTNHTCGLRDSGTLWCWGRGGARLGHGDSLHRLTPEQVGNDNDWAMVSTGAIHTCGVRDDGTLWCWGQGPQIGLGEHALRDAPEQVSNESGWASVSTGLAHTLAIRASGAGWAWGENSHGQLGDGTGWKGGPTVVPPPL